MYEIESGVPLLKAGVKARFPFKLMKVGDSFAVPDSDVKSVRVMASAYTIDGRRFSVRKTENGARVWRTA